MKGKFSVLFKLFYTMLYISAFTFGGGFVIVTLMKKKFVDRYHWIEEDEMMDMIALSQSAPGPIAVNCAIQAGSRIAGAWGVFFAVLGTALPPFVILSLISVFYRLFAENRYVALFLKGMQAGVAAVITDVVLSLGKNVMKERSFVSLLLMITAFVLVFFFKVNAALVVLGAVLAGVLRYFFEKRKEEKA